MSPNDTNSSSATSFSAEERAAMKERAAELKAAKGGKKAERELQALLDKIAELPDGQRLIAERLHAAVLAHAPGLAGRTWYGMPAYAQDDKVLCFLQPADKFKTRYSTLGFNDLASLDDGPMWPTAFAITEWTPAVEKQVIALLKKATGS